MLLIPEISIAGWLEQAALALSNTLKAFRAACRYCIDLSHAILADISGFASGVEDFGVPPPHFE